MSTKQILRDVEELLIISKRWVDQESVPAVERELALDRIKRVYEQVLFMELTTPLATVEESVVVDEQPIVKDEVAVSAVEDSAKQSDDPISMFLPDGFDIEGLTIDIDATDEPDIEIEIITDDEDYDDSLIEEEIEEGSEEEIEEGSEVGYESESVDEEQKEVEGDEEAVEEGESQRESFVEEVTEELVEQLPLIIVDEIEYEDEDEEPLVIEVMEYDHEDCESEEEESAKESVSSQAIISDSLFEQRASCTLSDMMGLNAQPTIADVMAQEDTPIVAQLKVSEQDFGDLLSQVSIGDRYLIAQDLFDGDTDAGVAMLTTLSQIDNFDDCMIYIVENYPNWDPEHPTTKIVLGLLERKFLLD